MSTPETPRTAPAALRNLPPILASLARHAPTSGKALEIASGTGQQIPAFAAAHPGLTWQASDRDADNIATIAEWAALQPQPNLLPPVVLDAARSGWSRAHGRQNLILIVNLLHLVSTAEVMTLLAEATDALAHDGRLMVYGPFLRDGQTTSENDAEFHATLRAANPETGYKDVAWVIEALKAHGMATTVEEMPANNLMLIASGQMR